MHRALDLRLGHIKSGFEPDIVRFRDELVFPQILVALIIGLGFFEVGVGLCFAGQRRFVAGLALVELGQVEVRSYFEQQISLVDELAFFDRQFNDLAADLGIDLHLEDRLDFAVGDHLLSDVAAGDFFDLHRDHRFAFAKKRHRSQSSQYQPDD